MATTAAFTTSTGSISLALSSVATTAYVALTSLSSLAAGALLLASATATTVVLNTPIFVYVEILLIIEIIKMGTLPVVLAVFDSSLVNGAVFVSVGR